MIYCVEDERNIRELLVYTLHSTGFEAKGLENGTQLFEELGNLIPDLILLDIMLPGDDGYTILEKIRQMPEVRDVPVIMVTAKGAEFDKVKGLDLGADDYITKPWIMVLSTMWNMEYYGYGCGKLQIKYTGRWRTPE